MSRSRLGRGARRAFARRRARLALACAVVGTALGCGGPGADTPSVVIEILPETICAGDDFGTEILLDGTASSAHLALIPTPPAPGEPPLVFSWTVSGAEHRIVSGALDADRLVLTSAGDRPLHVGLTVTNSVGGSASHVRTMPLTLPLFAPCADDAACAAGQVCATDLGLCIEAGACRSDDDCAACTRCELPSGRCVPEGP